MQDRLTVIYVDHSDDFSGGQKSLLALLSKLDRTKIIPIVVIDRKAQQMATHLRGLDIEPIQINFFNISLLQYPLVLAVVFRLLVIVRKARPTIVHCNTFKAGLIGAICSFFTSAPMVFRARLGILLLSHGFIDRIICARSNLILANSNYVKETFNVRFGYLEKVKVIYNPLPPLRALDLDKAQIFKSKFSRDPGIFCLGVIGRIEPFKNLDLVIEAARILSRTRSDFKVLLIGADSKLEGGRYRNSLKQKIADYGLNRHFEFTGFVEQILELSSILDCVLICSEGEALSRGVYESQTLGVPVIGSNSGGNKELISHNKTGLLFDVGSAESLANQIEVIMDNPPLRKAISLAAKESVLERFSDENTVEKESREYFLLSKQAHSSQI